MKRYSQSRLSNLSFNEFAADILQQELDKRDAMSPTSAKLRDTISALSCGDALHMTYPLMASIFRAWEKTNPTKHLTGYIVFSECSFQDKNTSLAARTYKVSSFNKAYRPNMLNGRTIYGSALDGSDPNARLDTQMIAEHGGKTGWRVDYCLLTGEV